MALLSLAGALLAQTNWAQEASTNGWTGVRVFEDPEQAYSPAQAAADRVRAQQIKARLEADRWVYSFQIGITVRQGVATLRGTVDDTLARERAAGLARTIPDVRQVDNQIQVSLPARRPEEIRDEILVLCARDPSLGQDRPNVQMKNGFAILSGQVASGFRKELAENLAKSAQGVRGVENKLSVNHLARLSDRDLCADVNGRLQWDPWLEHPQISVAVTQNRVRLTGVVDSPQTKERAIRDAQAAGATAVEANELQILDQPPTSASALPEVFRGSLPAVQLRLAATNR